MPSKDFGEDVAFLLYLVPVVASIVYGIYEWAATASTSTMPPSAYLVVSKSPYLFLVALVSICAAIAVEVRYSNKDERNKIIQDNTRRLQILAVVVLIISYFAALSASSYDVGNGFSFFVNGRYALIYAFFLIGISLLLSPKQILGNAKLASVPEILGLVLLVLAPIVFYGGLKIHLLFALSAIGGLIVGIIGFILLVSGSTLFGKKSQQPQKTVAAPATPQPQSP
ncbi:MAG: hypothetical protein OK457_04395 [Thaumarchaeota archaeon]|nr:hypothetical protein [Nitrososphaerota archaeon]